MNLHLIHSRSRRRTIAATVVCLGLVLGSLVATGCSSRDEKDVDVDNLRDVTVRFHWTAVGDDQLDGQAAAYDLRYAGDSSALRSNWSGATTVRDLPVPSAAGNAEQCESILRLELNRTYFFAIRAGDESGNWSPISNIIAYTPTDSAGTTAMIDFNAGTN